MNLFNGGKRMTNISNSSSIPNGEAPFKRNEKVPPLTTDKRMCATIFIAIPSLCTTHGRNPSFEMLSTLLSILLKFGKLFFFKQQLHHFN